MAAVKPKAARVTKPKTDRAADVIITLDPAAVSNGGLCIRPTYNAITEDRGYARTPEWFVSDSVWNTQMHDDLARVLARFVPRGGRVAFASTTTAFQGTALSIGRAIGCVEGLLHDLNVFPDPHMEPVHDQVWRRTMFPKSEWDKIKLITGANDAQGKKLRREAWKKLAIDTVQRRYKMIGDIDDNAAEAILLNDHVVLWRQDLWKADGVRREFNLNEWKRGNYGAQRT